MRRDISKESYNAYFREYRKKNIDKMRKYKRQYNSKWDKEHGYLHQKKEHHKFPEKEKCRKESRKALKNGNILKRPCQVCGDENSQMHHKDYSQPLKVEWYCPVHHYQADVRDGMRKVSHASLPVLIESFPHPTY